MRLISKKTILNFISLYPETEQSLLSWHKKEVSDKEVDDFEKGDDIT